LTVNTHDAVPLETLRRNMAFAATLIGGEARLLVLFTKVSPAVPCVTVGGEENTLTPAIVMLNVKSVLESEASTNTMQLDILPATGAKSPTTFVPGTPLFR